MKLTTAVRLAFFLVAGVIGAADQARGMLNRQLLEFRNSPNNGRRIITVDGHRFLLSHSEPMGPATLTVWRSRTDAARTMADFESWGPLTGPDAIAPNGGPWGYGESWFKSKYVARRTAKSGKLYTLEDPESWHCQCAGPEGAIVAEYATYHNHVEFSKPGMKFESTKAG